MYSTVEKLKTALGEVQEILLTDVEDETIEDILTEKSDIIDAYIQTVVTVPLESSSAIIENVCLTLSKAECYRRFARNDLPADLIKAEDKAFSTLEKIQQKKILIEAETPETSDLKFTCKEQFFTGWMR